MDRSDPERIEKALRLRSRNRIGWSGSTIPSVTCTATTTHVSLMTRIPWFQSTSPEQDWPAHPFIADAANARIGGTFPGGRSPGAYSGLVLRRLAWREQVTWSHPASPPPASIGSRDPWS